MESIIPDDSSERCYICRHHVSSMNPLHVHHMLHGPDRDKADRCGLTVHLCVYCHMALHDDGLYDRELVEIAQREFIRQNGRKKWKEIFGSRNYGAY